MERNQFQLSQHILHELGEILESINPYARQFKNLHEIMLRERALAQQQNRMMKEYSLVFFHEPDEDKRRFNNPTVSEVAAIFETSDGAPPTDRSLRIYPCSGNTKKLDYTSMHLDPMCYPLIWPFGQTGWHQNLKYTGTNRTQIRERVTLCDYVCYRVSIRGSPPHGEFNPLLSAGKLTQQLFVDYYCRIEGQRLNYLRFNQSQLRVAAYVGLSDALHSRAENENLRVGRIVVLPSSHIGSPRNMMQNYQDAMALIRRFGKPDYFITMTCNPKWPEIKESLNVFDKVEHRPDIVVRVFNGKVKELISLITTKKIFGRVKTLIYTIEFQKRGLPHIHMLLGVDAEFRARNREQIDMVVSAEIPDPQSDSTLHDLVTKHMIHGPCGTLNLSSVCMRDGVCSKNFPKPFQEETEENCHGYPIYRRRRNGIVVTKYVSSNPVSVDNSFVVPYNPYLLKYFRTHINVELCNTVQSIKYIYKYIYKGSDGENVRVIDNENRINHDEISSYLNSRYIGPTEAAYRIFKYPMTERSHTVVRLPVHLENEQSVYFTESTAFDDLIRAETRRTMLTAWMETNRETNCKVRYPDMPEHYVWVNNAWKPRMRGGNKTIGRMYSVPISQPERYYLRLLLLHAIEIKSFQDLKTVNGVLYGSYKEAANARGLLEDNNEWIRSIDEATSFAMPKQLRELFAYICIFENPPNLSQVFEQYKLVMSEDFLREFDEVSAVNFTLNEISTILLTHGFTLQQFGLPETTQVVRTNQLYFGDLNLDDCQMIADETFLAANVDQRNIISQIIRSISQPNDSNAFFIDGPGGTGKTFIYKYLINRLLSARCMIIPVAWTGIAAMLLPGGRTVHSRFKLPLLLNESSVSSMNIESKEAKMIAESKIIIWDEASMACSFALACVDRLLKDIMKNQSPFGGKTIVLGGDFRQVLPVVPRAGRHGTVKRCIKSSPLWRFFKVLKLTQNMRAHGDSTDFSDFLLKIGNGLYPSLPDSYVISLPQQILLKKNESIIDSVYGTQRPLRFHNNDALSMSAILCPKNSHCTDMNNQILDLMDGLEKTYLSINTIVDEDGSGYVTYPQEFLDSLELSGLPPHKLTLKVGAIVILLRNLNVATGLMNGTRLRVEAMHANSLDLTVISGHCLGKRVLLPKINLTPSDTMLPFNLRRKQFPVKLAFAITINKAQGQTLERVGIWLPQHVFSHGQLYVALSRARSFSSLFVKIEDDKTQSDPPHMTLNVVYKEVFK